MRAINDNGNGNGRKDESTAASNNQPNDSWSSREARNGNIATINPEDWHHGRLGNGNGNVMAPWSPFWMEEL
jgi:hypothetical protein